MQTPTRKYSTSDVVMLTSSATIVENAILHKAFLVSKRATWADPFLPNLLARINTAVQTYIGVDSAKNLRLATQSVQALQVNALNKLSEFNVQITQDFKKVPTRKNELLNTLGFNDFYQDAYKNKSQEALINLLFQFKKNMDAALKTEITAKGTSATSIAEIIAFADTLNNANVNQETYKSNRPAITVAAINTFNDIYDDVINVATISAKFFKEDKAIKDSFSFSKISAAQKSISAKTKSAKGTPKPPTS